MKLILTGATGAAGLQILRTAIADPSISNITVLSRRALPQSIPVSEKVTRIEHSDFLTYPPELLSRLSDHGACIWALGVSSRGMREEDYERITYEYPVAALKAFDSAGVRGADGKLRFVYLSGNSVDGEGKSRIMFSRVKGKAERDLTRHASASPSLQVYHLQPSYFFPSDPLDAANIRSPALRMLHRILGPVLNVFPSLSIKIEDLARFSLEAAKGRFEAGTFQNVAMKEMVSTWAKDASVDHVPLREL